MFSSLCQTGCQVLGQSIPGNALLLALVTQGLETYHAIGHLVLPEDQGKARAALVGLLELALEATGAGVDQQAYAGNGAAQLFGQGQGGQLGRFAEGADVEVGRTVQFGGDHPQG